MTIGRALDWSENAINTVSRAPRLEAEVLLSYVFGHGRAWILARLDSPMPLLKFVHVAFFVYRRKNGTPLAYITHRWEFYGHTFIVNKNVLIPRPESETLVEAASQVLTQGPINKVIELGTGSGCIAISLAILHPYIEIIGADVSDAALKVARANAQKMNIEQNLTWLKGNLLEPVESVLSRQVLLLANLPYLTSEEIHGDLKKEPRLALDGGRHGLDIYSNLISQIARLPLDKKPRYILLEIHPPTAAMLKNIIVQKIPDAITNTINDLANQPRVMVLKLA